MKKKGFTLIELLAVIVVLAIIALIATPIVMNVIKNAQKGAAERSAERYLTAVETAIATDRLEHDLIADGTYNIVDGQLEGTDLDIEVSGDYPKDGTVAIKNGQVVSEGTSMVIGDYTVTIDENGKATANEKGDALVLCTAATPTSQQLWNFETAEMESVVVGRQATESKPYASGTEYSCDLGDGARTFYVLKEDGDNIKLIMSENIGNTVAWAESGDNSAGPVTANAYLANQTSGWTKLVSVGGTVELPDDQAIYGGDWCRTNLEGNKIPRGYWLSEASFGASGTANRALLVTRESIDEEDVDTSTYIGVRPVITISKSNMSL